MSNRNQILPFSAISFPVEQQLVKMKMSGRVIYMAILASLAIAVLLLFIIKTDVTVRSAGAIKSTTERNDIKSPAEGIIDSIFIRDNSTVAIDQPLLKIRSAALEEKTSAVNQQSDDLQSRITDLKLLVAGKQTGLKTSVYAQQNTVYRQKLSDAVNRVNLAVKNFDRFNYLFKQNAVSALELDNATFDKQAAYNELNLVRQQQRSQWETELNTFSNQMQDMRAQQGINKESKSQYLIKAQVAGTIQELKGLQPGSFISANEIIGNISPNQALIAEVYVSPKDIGLIRDGNPVMFYIDAFNYTSWGSVEGIAESISDDVVTNSGQPYFKVRCKLNKTTLQLKNGYRGDLKKGMTVQARFKIARRTLFQLLYDQTSDWLNPNSTGKAA